MSAAASSSSSSSSCSSSTGAAPRHTPLVDVEALDARDIESDGDSFRHCHARWPENLHNGEAGGARGWICTINNPPREWVSHPLQFHDWIKARCPGGVRCIVHQRERGLAGTEHLQCYFKTINKFKFKAMQNKFMKYGWVDIARDDAACAAYCQKDDTRCANGGPYITGTLPTTSGSQGHRNDLVVACDSIKAGKSLRHVAQNYPTTFVKYHAGFASLAQWIKPTGFKARPRCLWFYGDTACGKTYTAYQMCRQVDPDLESTIKLVVSATGFFNGYTDQKNVIFDDFNGAIEIEMLFKLMDEGHMDVPVKGSTVPWKAELIIFTANKSPEVVYQTAFMKCSEHKAALMRRFEEVRHFNVPYRPLAPGGPSMPVTPPARPATPVNVPGLNTLLGEEDEDVPVPLNELSPIGRFYYEAELKNQVDLGI